MNKIRNIFLIIVLMCILCSCQTQEQQKEHIDIDYDFFCDEFGCELENEKINLEELFQNNFSVIRHKMQLIDKVYWDMKYRVYTKEEMPENLVFTCSYLYGEHYTAIAQIYTHNISSGEKNWHFLAVEFDSSQAAKERLEYLVNEQGTIELFQYNNCLISIFKGRSLLFQESVMIDGCEYTKDGFILVDGMTSKKVILPEATRRIDVFAFTGSYSIKEVVCNDNLEHIGAIAFHHSGLETIILNENLKSIGLEAFSWSKLKYVVIPKNVIEIKNSAFTNCIIYCEVEEKPSGWSENCFSDGTTVYYKGEWEYNSEGVPVPIDNN